MRITSSNIRTADYDKRSHILTMSFNKRPRWIYAYYHVPPKVWVNFRRAKSRGIYFHDYIKYQYSYKRTIESSKKGN